MKGMSAGQIAERMDCTGYSENDGPFSPDEPPQTQAVGACEVSYGYPHTSVTLHVYPSRANGAEVRKSWESVNGKGSTVWAGNVLLVFGSHDAEKLAEAFAATHDLVTHSSSPSSDDSSSPSSGRARRAGAAPATLAAQLIRAWTVLGAALLDPSALLEAATLPAGPSRPDEPSTGRYVRPVCEARATGIERQPAVPRVRARLIAPGADGRSISEVGKEFLTPRARGSLVWFGWQWPEGWVFKAGASAAGLTLVDYLPGEGTQFVRDDTEYRTSWTYSALGHALMDARRGCSSVSGNRHE